MKLYSSTFLETLGGFITILTATGITNEVVQIIYYVLGAIAVLFSLAFTIWKWYKSAKEDGKITSDEVEKLVEEVTPKVEELKDIADKINKGDSQ